VGEEAKMTNISLMRFQKLDCYVAAKELARLVHEAGIAHSVLRDQACRASVSCFLQLAEGLPNEGAGMRRKYFTESNNSLHETVAALDLALALRAVGNEVAAPIQELAFRLKNMLRALLNRP
jgi:four helix bundle protein